MVTGGMGGGRDRLGVWDWHVHAVIFKIKCLTMRKKRKTRWSSDYVVTITFEDSVPGYSIPPEGPSY